MSDLEKRMEALRPKNAPPDLRRELLSQCAAVTGKKTFLSNWRESLFGPFYPGDGLVVSLVAVWMVILILHLDTPQSTEPAGSPISMARLLEVRRERDLIVAGMESPRFKADLQRGVFSIPRGDLKAN